MRVLVCLDNTNMTTAVADYLEAHGVETECAADDELARRLLRFRHYDAILCEAETVPLARLAKTTHSQTRTVVLATDGEESCVCGPSVDALLVKPLPLSLILGNLDPGHGPGTIGDRPSARSRSA